MGPVQYALLIAVMVGFTATEFLLHRAQHFQATVGDNILDMLGFALLAIFTQPAVMWMSHQLSLALIPQYQNALVNLPWYAMVGLLLVGDDMMQYWWHRLSHSRRLWPLHRAHHSAHYMSARIIYRNNFFYYLVMPAIWCSGVLVYLGLGSVFLVYIVVKLTVITGAHSSVRWDEPLYKVRALRPLMWLVQRTISTPATHFAHHAMTNADGIGNYKGNFGNLLFFWDVLFGTAHITQQYPAKIGLHEDERFGFEKWWVELFYPLFWSSRVNSALIPYGGPFDDGDDAHR